MEGKSFEINLEGDYLSSFIYSGVLILVDSDFHLKAYSWERIINKVAEARKSLPKFFLTQFLLNSTNKKIPSSIKEKKVDIGINDLADIQGGCVDVGVWPSDLNIYKNRIYISSERGVDAIDFDWENGRITEFHQSQKIWSESSFSISSNSLFRLAIASGSNGVVTYVPSRKKVSSEDSYKLIESVCVDCDWQGQSLIANTGEGVELLLHEQIPKLSEFSGDKSEYWNFVNRIKKKKPSLMSLNELLGRNLKSSWLAGNKTFFMEEEGDIGFVNTENLLSKRGNVEVRTKSLAQKSSFGYSRTASFGTVIEIGENLHILDEDTLIKVDDNFSSWRVFPRSKNYANQLHIIKDHHLTIKVFENSEHAISYEGYGFEIDLSD